MESSQDQTMRQANAMKDQYERTVRDFESDPSKATGLSKDELERRRREAAAPRSVEIGDKTFKIQSTARAQQIMQKGSNDAQLNKRLEEVKKNASMMKSVRWISVGVSAIAIGMISYSLLLPMYVAQMERGKRLEMRAKQAYYAREQYEREQRYQKQVEEEKRLAEAEAEAKKAAKKGWF